MNHGGTTMKKTQSVLWGIALILIGVIFALNILNITDINVFFDGWWTLFIIVPATIGLFKKGSKIDNICIILIGVGLLLAARGIIDYGTVIKLCVPLILIGIGLSLIFKKKNKEKTSFKDNDINEDLKKRASANEHCAIFSNQTVTFDGQDFKGAELSAVFGGIKCNVDKAFISEDAVIKAEAVFGGISICIPDGVNVKIKSTSIFGGVSCQKKNDFDPSLPTIYIDAECVFAGVNIL